MKKKTLLICVSLILVLTITGTLFLVLSPREPSLFLQIGKPVQFDIYGNISAEQVIVHTDRDSLDIILLSMINAKPIPEEEWPTSLPDGRITVRYGATGYPYEVWYYEDSIIFGRGNSDYRRITNDHNEPVPLIKELIESIKTTFPN